MRVFHGKCSDMDFFTSLVREAAAWVTANNWPIVALVIALTFKGVITKLAHDLSAMSSRLTRLAGLEFQTQTQSVSDTTGEVMLNLKNIDVLDNDLSLGPFYDQFATLIESQTFNLNERYPRAVRAWAYTARARFFDNIARSIFESQVAALRRLKTLDSLDKRGLKPFYADHRNRALGAGIAEQEIVTIDEWMGFLSTKELVGRGDRGRYSITPLGTAFLEQLDAEGPNRFVEL